MAEEENDTAVDEESFEELAKRAEGAEDDSDDDGVIEIPVDDSKGERLTEKVQPLQANEFTCRSCFLVKHRSQLADRRKLICLDCA